MACKGGAGATFLASNLAYALAAEHKLRVALIDLNLRFGDAALYVSDMAAPSNVAELCRQMHRLDGALLESSMLEVLPNFSVLAAPEDPGHIADVLPAHVEAIIDLARHQYDVVVIDTGRTFDAISLRALDFADKIYCVLQLSVPFVRNAKRLLEVFHSLGYHGDKTRLLVNRYSKGGELEIADVEKTLNHKVRLTVPNQYAAVANSINLGLPLVKSQRNNPVSRTLIEMGRKIAVATPSAAATASAGTAAAPRWMSRVFGARA
jgi:pilus assembly protein CpaE